MKFVLEKHILICYLLKVALKTQKCRNQTIFEILPKTQLYKDQNRYKYNFAKKGLVSSAIKMDLNDSHPSPPFDPSS